VSFGQTRYRTTFEVSLVLLSAVALDSLWDRVRRGGSPVDAGGGTPRPKHTPEAVLPEPAPPAPG